VVRLRATIADHIGWAMGTVKETLMTHRLAYLGLAAACFALVAGVSAPASALPAPVIAQVEADSLVQNVDYYKRRWRRGTHVRAPLTAVDDEDGDTWVRAPFARVYSGRRGTWVRAPFVNLWIPR
jgi:hypothetical protein